MRNHFAKVNEFKFFLKNCPYIPGPNIYYSVLLVKSLELVVFSSVKWRLKFLPHSVMDILHVIILEIFKT